MYFTAVIGSGTLTDKIPLGTLMPFFVIEKSLVLKSFDFFQSSPLESEKRFLDSLTF
jgi:hypothetical protein